MSRSPEVSAALERLGRPIPLPTGAANRGEEVLRLKLASKARKAQALRSMAQVAQEPCWAEIRTRTHAVVEGILDRLPETLGQERDQLVGELKAWRAFASAPDEALELVRRLDREVAEIQVTLAGEAKA